MSLISIIIPVYNTQDYLAECLESILNQSFEDFEAICVNDGSSDSSLEILEQYSKLDSRIKIISKENKGASSARNKGLDIARGEYIYFLDSDDYISNLALEHLIENIREENSQIVITDTAKFSTDNIYTISIIEKFREENITSFNLDNLNPRFYNMIPISIGKFYKKNLIKDLRFQENTIFEDSLFQVQAFLRAKKISYLGEPLYIYRLNRENSVMTKGSSNFFDIIKVIEKIEQCFRDFNLEEKYKHELDFGKILYFLKALEKIESQYREELFNKIKSLKIQIDYNYYYQNNYSQNEKNLVKTFQMLNLLDYKEFLEGIGCVL